MTLATQLSLKSMETNKVPQEWGATHFGAIPLISVRAMSQALLQL